MKKIIAFIALAVFGINTQAQQRVYIVSGYAHGHDDLYVTETESGGLVYHIGFDNIKNPKDSVYIVLSKQECKEFSGAIRELEKILNKWTRKATAHNVTGYSRPVDVTMPALTFEWREYITDHWGYREFSEPKSMSGVIPSVTFIVDNYGHTWLQLEATLKHGDTNREFCSILTRGGFMDNLLCRCNTKWVDAQYKKLKPKPNEYYDTIFE